MSFIGQRRFTYVLKQFEPVALPYSLLLVRLAQRISYCPLGQDNAKTVENCLGGLSAAGRAAQDPSSFSKGNEFSQGLDLHFLHHPVAMGLNGTFGPAQRAGDLLVGVAANDKFEDFPLARRQCRDMSANHVQLALQATRLVVMRNGASNCLKKLVRG